MIRILGSILILGTTLWWGVYFAMKEKCRLRELEELERSMLCLQGQISYLSAPLAEAMESIGWRTEGSLGLIFQKIAEALAERKGESAEEIWKEIWRREVVHTFLTEEDLEEVYLFGRSLGYLDKTQQANSISLFLRYIGGALEQGKKRLEKNGRLYYGMGALSGLLIVVSLY